MIAFDTNKKYVLIKYMEENGIYDAGKAMAITFGDTMLDLKQLCNNMGYELNKDYLEHGRYMRYSILTSTDYIKNVNWYFNNRFVECKDKPSRIINGYRPSLIDITNIQVGDEIVVPHDLYGEIDFICIGKDHDGVGTITLLTKYVLTTMAFDVEEPKHKNKNIQDYGNNRYKWSNLLQWLNSDAPEGEWYKPQHAKDEIVCEYSLVLTDYTTKPGLLYGFSDEFKNQLVTVNKRTKKNTVLYNGKSESVLSKVFLLSATEVGIPAYENDDENDRTYEYFQQNDDKRIARLVSDENNKSYEYWLRTPDVGSSHKVFTVCKSGVMDINWANRIGVGVRFALVLTNK